MTPQAKGTRASHSRVFLVLNPFMRFMLRLPIKRMQERLLLLSFTGRKSGKHFTVPLSYAEDADGSLLIPAGGAWKLNLAPGRSIQIRLRGKYRTADPEVIWNPADIERLLPLLVKDNPQGRDFVGVTIGPDGKPDRGKLEEAIRDGFAIVRLRLISGQLVNIERVSEMLYEAVHAKFALQAQRDCRFGPDDARKSLGLFWVRLAGSLEGGCCMHANKEDIGLLSEAVTYLVEGAYRGMARTFDVTRIGLLRLVATSGPLRPSDAAEVLAVNPSTITRYVQSLEEFGCHRGGLEDEPVSPDIDMRSSKTG